MSRHDGVQGNECADSKARAVASEGSSLEDELLGTLREHTLLYSLTMLSSAFREALQDRWKSTWAKSPQKGWMDKIDDKLPSHSFLTSHMSRAQASILMQLRTGHIPLNYFLHKISKVKSPVCPACQLNDETVHHYLFECPGFAYERHSLARATGRNSKLIQHLLGNWRTYKSVLTYVHVTERFKNTYGNLSMRLSQADNSH